MLRESQDDMPPSRALRAGLYLVRDLRKDLVYVVFWPQDATWNDNATETIVRNRYTFIRSVIILRTKSHLALPRTRYLTKLTGQVLALISDEHSDRLFLSNRPADVTPDLEDDSDRMFACRVTKTEEQQETVSTTPGFEVSAILSVYSGGAEGVARSVTSVLPPAPPTALQLIRPRSPQGLCREREQLAYWRSTMNIAC